MFKWLRAKFIPKMPEEWMVLDCGQSLTHMQWYCHVVNKEDLLHKMENPRRIWVEEQPSLIAALDACIAGIHKQERILDNLGA